MDAPYRTNGRNENGPARTGRRISWAVIAAAIAFACLGCGRLNWRGTGYGDNSARWARKMRPPADEKSLSGLDARAQDIERDLGVR
jgi:hypothetical protein